MKIFLPNSAVRTLVREGRVYVKKRYLPRLIIVLSSNRAYTCSAIPCDCTNHDEDVYVIHENGNIYNIQLIGEINLNLRRRPKINGKELSEIVNGKTISEAARELGYSRLEAFLEFLSVLYKSSVIKDIVFC